MSLKRILLLVLAVSAGLALSWQLVITVPQSEVSLLVTDLDGVDVEARKFAAAKLADVGDQAVPELLAMLTPREPARIEWLRPRVPATLLPPPPPDRAQVLRALEAVGAQAERAIPRMLALLDGRRSPQRPANILVAIGPPAVAPVCRVLEETTNANLQAQLVRILADMGTNASSSAPAVQAHLAAADPSVREAAAAALWRIRTEPASAIPELRKLLHDEVPAIRQQAANGLASYGSSAAEAALDLLEATQDPTPMVRLAVVKAILQLGDARAREIAIRQLANDPDPENQALARTLASRHEGDGK